VNYVDARFRYEELTVGTERGNSALAVWSSQGREDAMANRVSNRTQEFLHDRV
jgi:hypothetical protein